MSRLYRCVRCNPTLTGKEFACPTDAAQCPDCGKGDMLVMLTRVHWLLSRPDGSWYAACAPQLNRAVELSMSHVPGAVTCERCRQHPQFEEALEVSQAKVPVEML